MGPRPSRAGAAPTSRLPGSLAGRGGPASWWVPGWIVLTVVATGVQVCLVWRLLSQGAASGTTVVLVSVVSVLAAMVGLVAWQPGRVSGSTSRGRSPAARVVRLSPPAAGVLGLITLVVLAGSGRVLPTAVAVLLWVSAGLAAMSLGRSWRRLSEDREPTRAEVVLPGLLLVAVLGVLAVLTVLGPPGAYAVPVTKVAAVAAIIGLAIIPAAAISETAGGASTFQRYASSMNRVAERRPVVGLVVVLSKLVLIVLVVLVADKVDPSPDVLPSSGRIWLVVATLGLLALSVLVVERRIGVTVADHRSLVRGPGLLVGAGIGGLMSAAGLVMVAGVVRSVPLTAACTSVLVVGCVVLGRRGPRRLGWWAYLLALVGGVVGAVLGQLDGQASLLGAGDWLKQPRLVVATIAAGATVAAVLLAVGVGRARRRRLLVLSAGVVVWVLLVVVSNWAAPGWSLLDLDLALAVILLVAWVTWRCGLQSRVDGFEVVVAAVVTTLVLEPLLIMDRLVGELLPVVLVLVAVGPGVLASVRLWVRAARVGAGERWSDVGRSTTLYGLLLAVVGLTGATSSGVLDRISEVSTAFLLLPLALLLVSATSAARQEPALATSSPGSV